MTLTMWSLLDLRGGIGYNINVEINGGGPGVTPKANETKVQQRKDGTCYTQIPAFARDSAELKGGTILRWIPSGRGWVVEVAGYEEPKQKET